MKSKALSLTFDRNSRFAIPKSIRENRGKHMDRMLPKTTIIIVNWNMLHHLHMCLHSVVNMNYPDFEIMLVDNASTDGSATFTEQEFPQVKIIRNNQNLGYAAANNVGFKYALGEYIAVLNPDTKVHSTWLLELVLALERNPSAGLATPKILMMNEPNRINTCGNDITLTGLTVCRGFGQKADAYENLETVSAVSGAAFVIKRSVLNKIDGFDESLFAYYEDTDLSLRAMLAGFDCIYVPSSIVYHRYEFNSNPRKIYLLERNRMITWLKTFRWRTLVIMIPLIIVAEAIAWGYTLLRGPRYIVSKLRANIWILQHFKQILEARRQVQLLRAVDDKKILRKLSHHLIVKQTINKYAAKFIQTIIQPILFIMGKICRALVTW